MSEKVEPIIYIFGYIIDSSDTEEFRRLTHGEGHLITEERDGLLDQVNVDNLSEAQRLLVMFYVYTYCFLRGKNVFENDELFRIHERLSVSKEFGVFLFKNLKSLQPDRILEGRSILESVFNPNEYISQYASSLVVQAVRGGQYIDKQIITGLSNREYEHPFDRKALDTLETTPGLELLVKKFNQYGVEKLLKIQYTGSNIKVTPHNFPYLYNILEKACAILSCYPVPDLYLSLGFVNAFTQGVEKPLIVITSGCVGLLSYDELLFILGHEIGHIKSRHLLYQQMATILPILGNIIGSATLGIGGLVSKGLEIALLNWQRKSEFTADRAGLLACQNIKAASTVMMKLAGAPPRYYAALKPEDFEKQAREFAEFDIDNIDKIAKTISVMWADHPWTVMRGHELYQWIETGAYARILKREQKLLSADTITPAAIQNNGPAYLPIYCMNCGQQFGDEDTFCTNCGEKR